MVTQIKIPRYKVFFNFVRYYSPTCSWTSALNTGDMERLSVSTCYKLIGERSCSQFRSRTVTCGIFPLLKQREQKLFRLRHNVVALSN